MVPFDELDIFISDSFIISLIKFKVMDGTGSPVASHLNVTGFVSFSSKSFTPPIISAGTKKSSDDYMHSLSLYKLTLYCDVKILYVTTNTIIS